MARLRFKHTAPLLGWRYRQSETGLVITATSLGELARKVSEHRQHKNLQPTDMASIQIEIERQLCGRLGNSDCIAEPGDNWVPVRDENNIMSVDKIISFSRAAWEWIKSGGELVVPEEAERRAKICRDCPANADSGHGCFNCALGKLVRSMVPQSRQIEGLKTCMYCGCDLQSKVNLPEAGIIASDKGRNIAFPDHCWQRQILDTHKNVASHEK